MPKLPIAKPAALLILLSALSQTAGCAPQTPKPESLQTRPASIHSSGQDPQYWQGIQLLGSLEIQTGKTRQGIDYNELSGLAWDPDSQSLYAISDRGWLHQFRPLFTQGRLSGLQAVQSQRLKGPQQQPLKPPYSDAEGLVLVHKHGQKELWISYERIPRIQRHGLDGRYLGQILLPPALANIQHYASRNLALEALNYQPPYGWLSLAERPMKNDPPEQLQLHAQNGQHWRYPLAAVGHSAVTAIERITHDRLLILERRYTSPLTPVQIRLRSVTLPPNQATPLQPHTLATFDNGRDWNIDNFEGLTRTSPGHYLMISDNNANPLQRSLLTFFALRPAPNTVNPTQTHAP